MFGFEGHSYTPVQLYQVQSEQYQCQLYPPAAELAPYLHYLWCLQITAGAVQLPVVPDNSVDLVISAQGEAFCGLYFPTSELFEIPLQGPAFYFGVCMQPHQACELFGRSMAELKLLEQREQVQLQLVNDALIGTLRGHLSRAEKMQVLQQYLLDLANVSAQDVSAARNIVDADDLLNGSLASLASMLHTSERSLRRSAGELFGFGPKKIHRVLRLQHIVQQLLGGQQLPDVFYDDSHLTRELKLLTGLTPGAIKRLAEKYNAKRQS